MGTYPSIADAEPPPEPDDAPVDPGRPGASLGAKTTAAFAAGARGEERVAEYLKKACGDQALVLHNRRLGPGRRDGDIDHLAVTASGVFVVDAKNYRSATVVVRRRGGLFGPVREQLIVSGRDRTGLLDSAHRQQRAVAVALDATAAGSGVPLTAVLCFLAAAARQRVRRELAGRLPPA